MGSSNIRLRFAFIPAMGDERVQLGRLDATDRFEDANEQLGVGSEGAVGLHVVQSLPELYLL
jgi:hypothetical protein